MKIDNWYEVRADGEKVAAFAPISRKASTQAFELVDKVRVDLYRDKVIEIVAVYTNPFCPREEVIYETHPTVLEDEPEGGWPKVDPPVGCVEPLPYDLRVL